MNAPSIEIQNAKLEYDGEVLFQGLSLLLPAGEFTCLLGPSGVGKTTLLRLLAGLKTSAHLVSAIRTSDDKPIYGRIAYLAQNEQLLPWLTALDNILIGQRLRAKRIDKMAREKAEGLLSRVGLERYSGFLPHQLSGGMRQRVLLARTLFEDKPIILLDEPFAALDVITRTRIQELASELLQGRTTLLITHDPLEALRLGHHIYVMSGHPARVRSHLQLLGSPPRGLLNAELMQVHASILDQLSHAIEVKET